jgi:putative ABC transport system substrate-binding protein
MHKTLPKQFLNSCSNNRKSKTCPEPCRRNENPKWLGTVAIVIAFAMCGAVAQAQQAAKVPRIGYLSIASSSDFRSEAFRQGLRDLGYIEGQNIAVESRWADGRDDRVTDLAAELVRLKVDVIVSAGGTQTTAATKKATETIPIVFATVGDPVGAGLVASFARPGGNVTGLSNDAPELSGKRLELLKEAILRLSRLAVLTNPNNPSHVMYLKETEVAAQALGLQTQVLGIQRPDDFDNAFLSMRKLRTGALVVLADAMFTSQRRRLAELAINRKLPVMFSGSQYVEAGGLMSYGPNLAALHRRAASYVDKILKGTKPADLPVEGPTKFEFMINLKTAKQIGLTIPPNVLARADKVIR